MEEIHKAPKLKRRPKSFRLLSPLFAAHSPLDLTQGMSPAPLYYAESPSALTQSFPPYFHTQFAQKEKLSL